MTEFKMPRGIGYGKSRRRRTRSVGGRRKYRRKSYRRKAMSAPRRRTRKRSYKRRYKKKRFSRKRRKSSSKRGHFKTIPKAVRRAGTLACPVVYECIKKIADTNTTYALKDCDGVVTTTVDKFVTTYSFDKVQGPYDGVSETTIPPCGQMGMPIFSNVATGNSGAQTCTNHPADILYRETPFWYHAFPLLAMSNPAAGAKFNGDNCRDSNTCNIISFDNRHSMRITWPAVTTTASDIVEGLWGGTLMLHEVVWWVPDLSTIIDQAIVNTSAQVATVALAQVRLRICRSWLKRMYNAYFCPHPVLDDGPPIPVGGSTTAMLDVVDIVTGAVADAFDCWNEPLHTTSANQALQITDDNMMPRFRDTKEYMATGVLDRRKDARPVWNKKRTFRRPRSIGWQRQGQAVDENAGAGATLNARTQYIKAGRRFPINKKMQWEKLDADSAPGDEVREVVPRGCYVYAKYFYYRTNIPNAAFQIKAIAPTIAMSFTMHVDKTLMLKWQNV